jgi:hypothetical protein
LRLLTILCLFVPTIGTHAQRTASKPRVVVREVRVDAILIAFGVDTAHVRAVVVDALRNAHRLAPAVATEVPAVDVVVMAPRPAFGGMPEPRGFVRVEVGRNLMETGAARTLMWEGSEELGPSLTFRELSGGALASVLRVLNRYLLERSGGA